MNSFLFLFLLFIFVLLILIVIKCLCKDNFYNIKEINFKTHFFNNRGLAQLSDKKLDIIGSDTDSNFDKKYFENLKDFDKIFLTTNMFKKFIKEGNINKKLIIILSCSDSGFPNEFSKIDKINYIDFIENNKNILKVFCVNYDLNYDHYKIKCIPIGIDYHTHTKKK
jgi:hypothetical protein